MVRISSPYGFLHINEIQYLVFPVINISNIIVFKNCVYVCMYENTYNKSRKYSSKEELYNYFFLPE